MFAFVIQIHSGFGPRHYDLMLQHGRALATWQLPASPEGLRVGQSLAARHLPDHRLEYLTYRGPVSRGRGEVQPLDQGALNYLVSEKDRLEVELNGRIFSGRYELRRRTDASAEWELTRLT